MSAGNVVECVVGLLLAGSVLWDAFETVLVPRRIGRRFRLTSMFYTVLWRLWRKPLRRTDVRARREAALGAFAPLSILLLLACWALGLIVAFALLQGGLGTEPGTARHRVLSLLYLSGQTFFTLGFGDMIPGSGAGRLLSVIEAGLGFGFLGTVVGYLPTMYAAFSTRELGVALLDARAGSPPTAAEALRRLPVRDGEAQADDLLLDWERWSAQVLESHISYPLLGYYRSQHNNQSWVATITMMLDTSALLVAGARGVRRDHARATFAIARHALVDVSQSFVRRPLEGAPPRMAPDTLARLRAHLAGTPVVLPDTPEYADRLEALRLLYEPYAQALAAHLLFDLPPWIHDTPHRDNWRGGPWDKSLGVRDPDLRSADDHF